MSSILEQFGGEDRTERVVSGRITRIDGDRVYAVIPSFNLTHEFGPIRFESAGVAAPGDPILIGFDEQGTAWVISWDGVLSPSGPAGGDLGGSYPNPIISTNLLRVDEGNWPYVIVHDLGVSGDRGAGLYLRAGNNPTQELFTGTVAGDNLNFYTNGVGGITYLRLDPDIAGGVSGKASIGFTTRTYPGVVDAKLYREAAGHLKTDTAFTVGGAFTALGTATASTPSVLTNDTQIATTAFVYANPRMTIADTRATEEAPMVNAHYQRTVRSEFKERAAISGTPGTGSFGVLTTYSGWSDDSGGGAKQVWLDDSNPPRMFVRRGTIAGGWSAWDEVAKKADIQPTGAYVPIGTILPFAGSSAPTGYLLCDGTSYPTATYPALHGAIGYAYGGSGSNFNVPNLKGKMPVGRDAADAAFDTLGEIGGAKTVTLSASEMPTHSHVVNSHNHGGGDHNHAQNTQTLLASGAWNDNPTGGSFNYQDSQGGNTANSGTIISSESPGTNTQGGGAAHENMPPFIVVNYIIRAT